MPDTHEASTHAREETERGKGFGVRKGLLTNAIGLDSACGIHILEKAW